MTGSDRIPYRRSREDVPADGRQHYDAIAESRGGVRGPFPVLVNSPELAGRIGHLGEYVRFEGRLPDAVRELAILVTARTTDCAFEWAAHEPIARDAGVRPAAIEAAASGDGVADLDDAEATVIEYAHALLARNEVPDATYDAAHERFGDAGVVELTVTVGYYAMIAAVLNAFEVLPPDDAPSFA